MRTCHVGSHLPRSWARQGADTIRRPRDLDGADRPLRSLIVRGLPCSWFTLFVVYLVTSATGHHRRVASRFMPICCGGRAFFCIRLAYRVGIEIGRPAHRRGCAACCCIRTAHRAGIAIQIDIGREQGEVNMPRICTVKRRVHIHHGVGVLVLQRDFANERLR